MIGVALAFFFLLFKDICADLLMPLMQLGNNVLGFIAIFVGFYSLFLRYTHQGQVCAGIYLQNGDSHEGYMMTVGTFYLVIGYLYLFSCGCFCCGLCCFLVGASVNQRQ